MVSPFLWYFAVLCGPVPRQRAEEQHWEGRRSDVLLWRHSSHCLPLLWSAWCCSGAPCSMGTQLWPPEVILPRDGVLCLTHLSKLLEVEGQCCMQAWHQPQGTRATTKGGAQLWAGRACVRPRHEQLGGSEWRLLVSGCLQCWGALGGKGRWWMDWQEGMRSVIIISHSYQASPSVDFKVIYKGHPDLILFFFFQIEAWAIEVTLLRSPRNSCQTCYWSPAPFPSPESSQLNRPPSSPHSPWKDLILIPIPKLTAFGHV